MEGEGLDNALLLDAAFQIIDASLDTKVLFHEACQLSKQLQENSVEVSMSDLLSVSCMQIQESRDGVSHKSILSTPALAKEVIRLAVQNGDNQSVVCSTLQFEKEWNVCLNLIQESIHQGIFIPGLFSSWISKHGLKLEFLWDLHKVRAYNLHSHLALCLKEDQYRIKLSQTLIGLSKYVSDDTLQRQSQILTGVTNLLINNSFTEDQGAGTRDSKMYLAVVDRLLQGIMQESESPVEFHVSPFSNLKDETIHKETQKKFTRHALSYCLQHQADFKVSERIPSVCQHSCTKSDKYLMDCLGQLMACLSAQELVDVLDHCLNCDEINSRIIQAFLQAFLSTSVEAGKRVVDYVRTSLTTGLQESDISHVVTAFYVARQCSSFNSPHFPTYRDWYQQTFGEATTSLASSRTGFGFLVKCLTNWTPEENPQHLKAHILRKPHIPAKMRDVYESYVMLAKTRLDDLKIPLRDVTSCDSSTNDPNQYQKHQAVQTQQDVEQCVKAFEEGGKIPTSILEASIFRKPYFVGKFLPTMLKPRCLPDKPDSKMKLIEEMRKSGRIPSSMYTSYKEGCETEKQNLLEGVFYLSDDGGDEMMMSPMEQLQFGLDHLERAVGLGEEKKVRDCIAHVGDRIQALMTQSNTKEEDPDSIEIDLNKPLDTSMEQIITKVLCCLSNSLSFVLVDYKLTKPQSFYWLDSCIAFITRFPLIKTSLIKFILTCLEKKMISGVSFDCLSATCISLMSNCPHLSLSVMGKERSVQDWDNLVEVYDWFLTCHCEEDVTFTLSFLLAYLFQTLNQLESKKHELKNSDVLEIPANQLTESQLVPPCLVKKLCLLCWRCRLTRIHSNAPCNLVQSSVLNLHDKLEKYVCLLDNDGWNRLKSEHEPSLDDWVTFESRFGPCSDILSKRQRLSYYWDIAGKFIKDVGLSTVCSQLFHHLAASVTSSRDDLCFPKTDSFSDFLSLLKGLLLQLPACEGESPWLLSTVRSCKDKNLQSALLSLSLHLHPHLVMCNQKDGVITDVVTSAALSLLDLFAGSNLNEGGFFSLDLVIFMCQIDSCFHDVIPSMKRFLCHPALFTSFGVQHESLSRLGLLSSCPDDFMSMVNYSMAWADDLVGVRGQGVTSRETISDWMKASALFSSIIKRHTTICVEDVLDKISSDQDECIPYLWELITVWFTHNMDHVNRQSPLKEMHQLIVLRHPSVVINSVQPKARHLMEFRHHIGIEQDTDLHLLCVLRQCSEISTQDMWSVCDILTAPLITAYSILLKATESNLDVYSKIVPDDFGVLSSWLGGLVNSCQSNTLKAIDLACLHTCDPLLYRQIYMKTHKS